MLAFAPAPAPSTVSSGVWSGSREATASISWSGATAWSSPKSRPVASSTSPTSAGATTGTPRSACCAQRVASSPKLRIAEAPGVPAPPPQERSGQASAAAGASSSGPPRPTAIDAARAWPATSASEASSTSGECSYSVLLVAAASPAAVEVGTTTVSSTGMCTDARTSTEASAASFDGSLEHAAREATTKPNTTLARARIPQPCDLRAGRTAPVLATLPVPA